LNYWWNFGIYSLVCLALQLVTGIFLAMHYVADQTLAFWSVEHIMRDVNFGWLIRYLHMNGASFFFLVVYAHIFRSLFYGSFTYPRQQLWWGGVLILFLMIVTAFLGYVLPWGQMSFWAATVITNLLSAVPWVGTDLVVWLWGGYSVDNPTLNRFYSLHFCFPFLILGLVFVHLFLLHTYKSNNPIGLDAGKDFIPFYPYYVYKDLFGLVGFAGFFFFFVFFFPNYLGHPDNYIAANALVTPVHIVPEWYFLPFYALLRSIPDKFLGVMVLFMSVLALFVLPSFALAAVRSSEFKPATHFFFWLFGLNCLFLGWVGSQSVEPPFVNLGKFTTFFYFFYLLILIPFVGWFENSLWDLEENDT
jgi:quinol-cytochrome oxidoreductase complex cytochrome b subunit